MGKRKSRTKKEESDASAVVNSGSTKMPSKKRAARRRKEEAAEAPLAAVGSSAGVNVEEAVQAVEEEAARPLRKLGPSKRQPPPPPPLPALLPPPLPLSSPVGRSTPLSSRPLLLPAASASDSPSADRFDATIRKLNFNERTAATPGRAENLSRQRQGQPMLVYCRIRPLSADEKALVVSEGRDADSPCIAAEGDSDVACVAPRDSHCFMTGETSARFTFTRVFPPCSSQAEVFTSSTRPLLADCIASGQNALIFAYGLTNSGKTFTVTGSEANDEQQQGIIPRAISDIFDRINDRQPDTAAVSSSASAATAASVSAAAAASASCCRPAELTVSVSFLEIYNEQVVDLLCRDATAPVRCRLQVSAAAGGDGHEDGEVVVKGLRECEVRSREEAMALLRQGTAARQQGRTALNDRSSRSHSVFSLKLLDGDGRVWCRLSIVDLAGSERSSRTKTESGDERRKEASSINKSLTTLGRCLQILVSNSARRRQEKVPFRDSALTRLFSHSLSGHGRTVMMLNVSMVHADYDETLSALKYASTARSIIMTARVDSHLDVAKLRKQTQEKKRMQRLKEEEDGDDGEPDDDEEPLDAEGGDAEACTVRLHPLQSARGDGEKEEEIMDGLNRIYTLQQELVAVRAAAGEAEQRLREEMAARMERDADEAEQRAVSRVEDERQRVSRLLERKFAIRQSAMDDEQAALQQSISALQQEARDRQQAEAQRAQHWAQERQREDGLRLEREQQMAAQRAEAVARILQLETELTAVQQSLASLTEELRQQAARHEQEAAGLQSQLAASECQAASLRSAAETEREERDRRERKERREWERSRKELEREAARREEAMQQQQQTLLEQEAAQSAQRLQEAQQGRQRAETAAAAERQKAEATKAELERRLAALTQTVESLHAEQREAAARQQAEAAVRQQEEGRRREEEHRTEEERRAERQKAEETMQQLEQIRKEWRQQQQQRAAAAQQPKPSTAAAAAPAAAPAVSPPPLPNAMSAAAAPAPPASSSSTAPVVAVSRSARRRNARESMDDFFDQYDDRLVTATIAQATAASAAAAATSAGSGSTGSLVKRGKARLSSALDALRFSSAARTAPASSLHHALNESRSVTILQAAAGQQALRAMGGASASAAADGLLLSPKVQRVLASSRRSRSKSRKGKENQHEDGEQQRSSRQSEQAAVSHTRQLSGSEDAAQFDRLAAAQAASDGSAPPQAGGGRYGRSRQQQQLEPVKPKAAMTAAASATPVAKRTRQHTASK